MNTKNILTCILMEAKDIFAFRGRLRRTRYFGHLIFLFILGIVVNTTFANEPNANLVDELSYIALPLIISVYYISCFVRRVRDIGGSWKVWLFDAIVTTAFIYLLINDFSNALMLTFSILILFLLLAPSDWNSLRFDTDALKLVLYLQTVVFAFSRNKRRESYASAKNNSIDLERFGRSVFFKILILGSLLLLIIVELSTLNIKFSDNQAVETFAAISLTFCSFTILGILLHVSVKRVRDIGWNPWFTTLIFVPVANIVFFLFLILAPEDFNFDNSLRSFFERFGGSILKICFFIILPLAAFLSKNADIAVKKTDNLPVASVKPPLKQQDEISFQQPEEFIQPLVDGYEIFDVDTSKLSDPQYRKELIEKKGVLLVKGGERSRALEFLNSPFKTPEILVANPKTNASIRNMYGQNLENSYVKDIRNQMNRLSSVLEQIETSSPNRSKEIDAKTIDEAITSDDNDVVIIVGHTVKGSVLLPTGTRLRIPELQRRAEQNSKKIVVFACNTIEGVDTDFSGLVSIDKLNYEPVLEAIKRAEISRCISGCEQITIGNYLHKISDNISLESRLDQEYRTNVKVILAVTSSSTGIGVIISEMDEK